MSERLAIALQARRRKNHDFPPRILRVNSAINERILSSRSTPKPDTWGIIAAPLSSHISFQIVPMSPSSHFPRKATGSTRFSHILFGPPSFRCLEALSEIDFMIEAEFFLAMESSKIESGEGPSIKK